MSHGSRAWWAAAVCLLLLPACAALNPLPLETLRLEATISVGPDNAQERYIVIFTARRALGGMTAGTVPQITPIFLPGVVTAMPTGRREPRYMHHAPVGRLRISVSEPK